MNKYTNLVESFENIPQNCVKEVYKKIASSIKTLANPEVNSLWESFNRDMFLMEESTFVSSLSAFKIYVEKFLADKIDGEDLHDNKSLTFDEVYPKADIDKLLVDQYIEWLNEIKYKSFYKTILSYKDGYEQGSLEIDRTFLFRLIKAITSCMTHLAIQAEIKNSAVLLFETYYDCLIDCLNNIVHARSEDDVRASYAYMLAFLNITDSEEENSPEQFNSDDNSIDNIE